MNDVNNEQMITIGEKQFNRRLFVQTASLELSVRSENTMRAAKAELVGDLIQLTELKLRVTHPGYFGRKSKNEIEAILETMDLRLGMEIVGWSDAPREELLRHSIKHQDLGKLPEGSALVADVTEPFHSDDVTEFFKRAQDYLAQAKADPSITDNLNAVAETLVRQGIRKALRASTSEILTQNLPTNDDTLETSLSDVTRTVLQSMKNKL